jgi:hypothetical protein
LCAAVARATDGRPDDHLRVFTATPAHLHVQLASRLTEQLIVPILTFPLCHHNVLTAAVVTRTRGLSHIAHACGLTPPRPKVIAIYGSPLHPQIHIPVSTLTYANALVLPASIVPRPWDRRGSRTKCLCMVLQLFCPPSRFFKKFFLRSRGCVVQCFHCFFSDTCGRNDQTASAN